MKYTGRKVRVYQDGEIIRNDFSLSYSESLEFVAIGVNSDPDIKTNKSKRIEIWQDETSILMSAEFKHMDIISNAAYDCLANDLLIFHNGSISDVMNYLTIEAIENNLRKVNDLSRRLIYETEKRAIKEHKDSIKIKVTNESYSSVLLSKIPMWIRQIFKAV